MTETLRARLQRLHAKATAAPWRSRAGDGPGGPWGQVYAGDDPKLAVIATTYSPDDDAALIAELRNALPDVIALASRVDALERFLAEVRDGKHSIPGLLAKIDRLLA